MRDVFDLGRGLVGPASRTLALATVVALSLGSGAYAANYDEATAGDLSNNGSAPTVVSFSSGDNIVTGTTGGFDSDYLTFSIAPGEELSSIVVLDASLAPDRTFFGIASGDTVVVDPSFTSAAGLIGWTLFSTAMDGTDVLDDLGRAAPADFPSVPGATGFTPPLSAGTYSTWVVDGDGAPGSASYSLDFVVSGAPEPSTWVMMLAGVGLAGGALRRRARRGSDPRLTRCAASVFR